VRVNTRTLDRFLSTVGEVILNTSQVRTVSQSGATQNTALSEGLDRMDRVVGELQRRALELRTTPLLRILEPLPRAARDVAERAGVSRRGATARGAELELDRSILDRLSDPLVHLLRNAVDHGIEPPDERIAAGKSPVGCIAIEARREKDSIRLSVSDDGAGIDLEPCASARSRRASLHADLAADLTPEPDRRARVRAGPLDRDHGVGDLGPRRRHGRGALDARVAGRLGGDRERARARHHTTLVVPITAAVQRVLLLGVGAEIGGDPIAKVERIEECPTERSSARGADAFALIDGELVPVLDLGRAHRAARAAAPASSPTSCSPRCAASASRCRPSASRASSRST
jgi:two-component system chemotaxis sensor kinase CheA